MKRLLAVVLLTCLVGAASPSARTGIAYDNSDAYLITGSDSRSYTVTGANPVLFIGVLQLSGSNFVTGISYAGVAPTEIAHKSGNGRYIALYVLSAPATGSNTLSVSLGTVVTTIVFPVSYSGAAAFSGASVDNFTTQTASSTSTSTTSLTPVADNCWTVLFTLSEFNPATTASTGTTQRQNAGVSIFGDSGAAISPAASTSMTVTTSGADTIDTIMASFAPFAGGGVAFPAGIPNAPIRGGGRLSIRR